VRRFSIDRSIDAALLHAVTRSANLCFYFYINSFVSADICECFCLALAVYYRGTAVLFLALAVLLAGESGIISLNGSVVSEDR
jgi:hypothetical protein